MKVFLHFSVEIPDQMIGDDEILDVIAEIDYSIKLDNQELSSEMVECFDNDGNLLFQ